MNFVCKPFAELTVYEWYDVAALRQLVFVVEQNCCYLDLDGKDKLAWHLMGYEENELVAYTRLLPKGVSYPQYTSIGRVVTHPLVRRKGAGIALLEKSIEQVEQLFGKGSIKIGAQQYLTAFYQKFGFEVVGEMYLEDHIPHVPMLRL
ncbi:MAG: GNAT family N-acetyltransferase [Saprospiraceae bacterium]|nr:GNAT family N-acetyltransferase [Saprospiraceae bacterium]